MVVVLPFSGITPALSQLILKGGLVTMEGQLSMLVYGTTCTRALIFKQELRLAEDVGQPNILASLAYSTMFFFPDSFIANVTVPPPPTMLHDIGEVQEVDPLDDISAFIIPPPPSKKIADLSSRTSADISRVSTLISNHGSGDRDINETLTCNDVKVAKVCIGYFH